MIYLGEIDFRLGATPIDSVGYPWNSRYTIASGNLLADFRANLNAESQSRLQVVRLYEVPNSEGALLQRPALISDVHGTLSVFRADDGG